MTTVELRLKTADLLCQAKTVMNSLSPMGDAHKGYSDDEVISSALNVLLSFLED